MLQNIYCGQSYFSITFAISSANSRSFSNKPQLESKIETSPDSESDEDYNPGSDVEMSDSDNDISESEVSETELKEELEYLKKDSPNTRRRKENIKYEESFDIMEMEQEDQHILGQIFGTPPPHPTKKKEN